MQYGFAERFVLWLHIFATVAWIGGIFFLTATGPSIRKLNLDNSREFFKILNRKFKVISWHSLILLVITGILNLHFMNALSGFHSFLASHTAFRWKLICILLMVAVKVIHDKLVGPRASEAGESSRWWKGAIWLGRLNLILGLIVIYLAISIKR